MGSYVSLVTFAGTHDPSGYYAAVHLQFLDSGGQVISEDVQEVNTQLPTMDLYYLGGTVPNGCSKVRFLGSCNGNWIKLDQVCMLVETCNASITGLVFNEVNGGADIPITNGGTYSLNAVADNYNLEALVSGTPGSVVFTVTGALPGSNTENSAPWNHPGTGVTWGPVAGSYTVNVKAYSQSGGTGALCGQATFTFTLLTCNNVTSGGTIAASQSGCSPFNPNAFTSSSAPSGGSGTLEIIWIKSTTNCPPAAFDGSQWTTIAGATSLTYDPGSLTQTTCFRRCARRAGCTDYAGESNILTITVHPALAFTTTTTSPVCSGASNGKITVNVTAGTTPNYSYNWSKSGGGTGSGSGITSEPFNISGLAAGTYTITVTNGNGCSATGTATISNPTAMQIVVSTKDNVSCNGGSDGQLYVTVTAGASGPYTYNWTKNGGGSGSGSSNTQPFYIPNLAGGTYNVTVTNNSGCTATGTSTVSEPTLLVLTKTSTNVSCNGGSNGSINLTVTGGTGTYTYNWGVGQPVTQDRTNLAAGTYTVTVTDINGCTKTTSATITQPAAITLSTVVTNVACNGGSTGSINLTVSGGTSPYTYLWTGGATSQDLNGKAAGTYSVTVTDANGCTKTTSATITQPGALAVSTTVTNVSCNGGSNGSINLTVTGGTTPYSYAWTGGATTQNLTGKAAGTYTVTVTDANGCTKTTSATITEPGAIVLTTTKTNVTLCSIPNGSIDLTVSGGTSPYTYLWSNGASTQDLSGLGVGNYTVTVTDANSCTKTTSATISGPLSPTLSTVVTNVLCKGAATGAIDLTVTGGTGIYTYNWGPGQPTTQDLANLVAGTYSVTVTDGAVCTAVTSATITQPATTISLSTTQVNVLCNGASTGSINLT
ncbi:MAG: SprB repeat-containing protein, partial [Saprospiraceae bacterium]